MALVSCGRGPTHGSDDQLVLHVGDEFQIFESLLTAAGEDKPSGYRIEWANFVGGPAAIAAETGGSVDITGMAETPLVFAEAAGSPVTVVAVAKRTSGVGATALVVAPDSPIHSVADLKGHAVGFLPGTLLHYLVIRQLQRVGLSMSDIRPVAILSLSPALLRNGTVDAFATSDPYLSEMLAAGQVRVLATGGEPVTPEFQYLVAPTVALADPRRAAAIGDFVARVARAARWQREHQVQAAALAEHVYKVTPAIAQEIVRRSGARYGPIDQTIVAGQQQEADTFYHIGLIRTRVDASKIFDRRYDAVVAQAEAGR